MAVYDAISSRVEGCAIKWPNDIVIDGRKVCGILTEMSSELDNIHYVVIGIGINVNTDDFPEDIASIAASMHVLQAPITNGRRLLQIPGKRLRSIMISLCRQRIWH